MLKIFLNAENPGTHNRSKTLSHLHPSNSIASAAPFSDQLLDAFQTNSSALYPVSLATPVQYETFFGHTISEPSKSHQRTPTEQVRFARDLPPLITRSSESNTYRTSRALGRLPVDPSPEFDSVQVSPEHSCQSTPTILKWASKPRLPNESGAHGKGEEKVGKLASWFTGKSEPISIGLLPSPTKEKTTPLDTIAESSDIRPTSPPKAIMMAQGMSKPAMASRFSFFSSKLSLTKSPTQPLDLNDELVDMDVSAALFPNGPADPFSPAAFKNLQQQAEGLLVRLQSAYKERTAALREMTAEKETLAEESEGAETRARHLKMQLDGLSVKLAEQDEAMMNLVDELAEEKQARRKEEEARKRSIRVVGEITLPGTNFKRSSLSNTISDSGFESEDDSAVDSVFSGRNGVHSPAMSMSSVSTTNSPDVYQMPEMQSPTPTFQATRLRVPQGLAAAKGALTSYGQEAPGEPVQVCSNCGGVRASEAWSVVGVLKEENKTLKRRVGELEGALDGCLDVVARLS